MNSTTLKNNTPNSYRQSERERDTAAKSTAGLPRVLSLPAICLPLMITHPAWQAWMQRWPCWLQSANQHDWRQDSSPTDSHVKEDAKQNNDKPPTEMHQHKDRELFVCVSGLWFWCICRGGKQQLKLSKQPWTAVFSLWFQCQRQTNQSMTSHDKWTYFEQTHTSTQTRPFPRLPP